MNATLWAFTVFYSVGWVANYILCGIAYGFMMKKRRMKNWGVAWIPILNTSYVVGRLSDNINSDYHQRTHRAVWMLILKIIFIGCGLCFLILFAPYLSSIAQELLKSDLVFQISKQVEIEHSLIVLLFLFCAMVVSIAEIVFSYISLFGIYREYAPKQALMYVGVLIVFQFFFNLNFLAPILVLTIKNRPSQFLILNSKNAF